MKPGQLVRRAARRLRGGTPPPRAPWVEVCPNPDDARPLETVRLFAVMGTWMEGDIVASTVANALAQGCERVYLVDNESPDDTVEQAQAAGAVLARTFATEEYDEALRLRIMNEVAQSVLTEEGDAHQWWMFLDADEFPHGPAGLTVKEHLATLDRQFRVVGARFLNHYPTDEPHFVPGRHPLDFQPMCEEQEHPFCPQLHRKHPVIRLDRDDVRVDSGLGFHKASTTTGEALLEPEGGLIEHHFPYRTEAFSRKRLEVLCGGGRAREGDIATGHMLPRFRSLEAVYARRWDEVENFMPGRPDHGVTLVPWTDLVDPGDTEVARWY